MRIWILNHYAVPLSGSSGTRHAVFAKYLAKRGHDVTIFASPVPHDDLMDKIKFRNGALYTDQIYEDYRFRFIKTPSYASNAQRIINMLSYRKNVLRSTEYLDKPDVIIGSSVHLHAADAGRILAKRFKIPFIFEIRDIWPEALLDIGVVGRMNPLYIYLRNIELRLYKSADHIITLLPGLIPYLKNHGISERNITYIPNGIDSSLYPESYVKQSQKEFIAMYFGAHGPMNQLETLVKAAKILRSGGNTSPIKIHLVGAGKCKPNLVRMKEEDRLDNIIFSDPLSKRELFIVAQKSSAFIFHLRDISILRSYGISSNKLYDYMMCGKPIIFACHSYNNPVDEANAGVSIPPNNPNALAQALIHLSELDDNSREKMGNDGRRWVLQNHNLARLVMKLEKVMNYLI